MGFGAGSPRRSGAPPGVGRAPPVTVRPVGRRFPGTFLPLLSTNYHRQPGVGRASVVPGASDGRPRAGVGSGPGSRGRSRWEEVVSVGRDAAARCRRGAGRCRRRPFPTPFPPAGHRRPGGYASLRAMGHPHDSGIAGAAPEIARRQRDPAGSSSPAVAGATGGRWPALSRPMNPAATKADLDSVVVHLERGLRARERRVWLWQSAIAAALFFALRGFG